MDHIVGSLLMQVDTTASDRPGFRDLGISPRSLELGELSHLSSVDSE